MFAEDLSVFFDPTELADAGVLDGVDVAGVFVKGYAEAFDGMSSTQASFMLPTVLTLTTTPASLLVVGGVTYRVRSVQPFGDGISMLPLAATS